MLLTPQPGISKVENPLTTSGAADAETLADARRNVPLTVLTLDRIVSARDFEDFTRAFAGIGKARADILWNGERQVIYLTIASGNAGPVDKESSLFQNLQTAINKSGHSNSIVLLENYKALTFSISARIAISAGYNFETVKGKVLQALTDTFSFMARDFGQDVTPSEVIAVIQSVEGVGFTDLELLNDKDPALMQHFRLTANVATSHDGVMKPAELLTINPDNIILTEILS
jgi:predicted phage baseplate assembly protein